jgi:uncharacterized membrane protein YdjX (TVP38/TMEM64 family)
VTDSRRNTAACSSEDESPPLLLLIKYVVAIRIGLLVLVLGFVYWTAHSSGLLEQASPEAIRTLVASWGLFGVLVYLAAFALGQLVYVPGMVFVVAGSLAFGGINGFLLGMLGAVLSVSLSFYVARLLGGTPLADPRQPWLQRLLRRLDSHPISSMVMLRLLVSTAPWLNYLLGMSSVWCRRCC